MKIDAHHHLWNYDPAEYQWMAGEAMAPLRRDFLEPELTGVLQSAGIDGTVVVQARQSLEESRRLLEIANACEPVLGVVGWVDLRSDRLEEQLERFAEDPKFVGVRHVVQDEPDDRFMLRPDFLRGIGRLRRHGLRYDILIYPRQLPAAIELVRLFPEQPFVLDHIAKPAVRGQKISPWREWIRDLAAFPHVWCKVSGMITEADWRRWKPADFDSYLDTVLTAFGAGRLMYGSDWPVCTLAGSYRRAFDLASAFAERMSPSEREGFLGGNALKFYFGASSI